MKYKIGDVVRLKSAEELIKEDVTNERSARERGGKSYKIDDIVNGVYWSGNFGFSEDIIECLVSEEEVLKRGATYTLDELKKRVDALKDYATKLSSELNVGLSIEVETEFKDCGFGKEYKGSSRINIMY